MTEQRITKVLSANDTGETGGHQAGILVPKDPALLSFFPTLDASRRNPRVHLRFVDVGGSFWEFAFIYYNNARFGGTRNEYRLTRMTKYIRQAGLAAGDEVTLARDCDRYSVSHERLSAKDVRGVLRLGTDWRIIQL